MIYLDDYITVSFSGTDGYGEAHYELDSKELVDVISKPEIDEYLIKVAGEEGKAAAVWGEYPSLAELIDFEFDKNKNLSNGDIVTLNASLIDDLEYYGETLESFKDYFKIDFETSFTYTVSDLQEYREVDIYGMVKDYIVYEGGSGNAKASFSFPENYHHVIAEKIYLNFSSSSINFVIDNQSIGSIGLSFKTPNNGYSGGKNGQLSNGEKFPIELSDYYLSTINNELHKCGYTIEKTTYEHTASGIGEYINTSEQMTPDMVDKFWGKLSTNFNSTNESHHFTPLSMYLLTLNAGEEMPYGEYSKCKIYVVYEQFKEKDWLFDEETKYRYACATDLIINQDGSIEYKFDSRWYKDTYSTAEKAVENFEYDGYSVKKIK